MKMGKNLKTGVTQYVHASMEKWTVPTDVQDLFSGKERKLMIHCVQRNRLKTRVALY